MKLLRLLLFVWYSLLFLGCKKFAENKYFKHAGQIIYRDINLLEEAYSRREEDPTWIRGTEEFRRSLINEDAEEAEKSLKNLRSIAVVRKRESKIMQSNLEKTYQLWQQLSPPEKWKQHHKKMEEIISLDINACLKGIELWSFNEDLVTYREGIFTQYRKMGFSILKRDTLVYQKQRQRLVQLDREINELSAERYRLLTSEMRAYIERLLK